MKNYEETTAYKCYEFTTHCKKLITALNRMSKIYPEITTDIMELKNTFEWYGGNFNECDDTTVYGDKQQPTYRFIVDFDGEFCYICMYYFNNDVADKDIETSTANDNVESDNKTSTDSADGNNETSTDNKTPAGLKAEINKKYGVNAVYYDTDSILCDSEKQNVCVHQNKSTDNEVYATTTKIIIRDVCDNNEICTITPYENGKELTTPIPKMKCLTCVIDYVKRLYALNVVTRETYFTISRVGKRNVVLTYTNTHYIVQYYNISTQMQALETMAIEQYGYYSKYTRKPLKSRQYDVLELYKKDICLTISQCNDDENVIKDWFCDITYKTAHHIGQYTYKELLHLLYNIRYNTQEYCDKYFDCGDTK